MLSENIKSLRKQNGYSQETLANQLNVVRQTISKWETGQSVPDADMLEKLATLFEVPVSTLLGSKISENNDTFQNEEIAKQLAILNEQLASQNRIRKRTLKILLISILSLLIITLTIIITAFSIFSFKPSSNTSVGMTEEVEISVTYGDTHYSYRISYDEDYQITGEDGDSWISENLFPDSYDDVNELIAQVTDYCISHNIEYEIAWFN